MKVQLIVNPKASKVNRDRALAAETALRQGNDLTVVETLYRGHAIDLAREAATAGNELVAVLGGDGTLNEAANGLAGTDAAMVCLPGGSTNVFARTIGFKAKLKPALVQARAAMDRPPRRFGLGLVNGRYFLFHVGMGFDAAVVAQVERKPHLKRKIGQAVFVYAAFATARSFDRSRPHLVIRDSSGVLVDDGYFAVCLNTNPYTYFGIRPLNMAPDATLDGPLSLVTLRTLKMATTLALVGSTLGSGKKLRRHPLVDYRAEVDAITVTGVPEDDGSPQSFPYQADGDYLGEAQQLTFTYEPDRLLLCLP